MPPCGCWIFSNRNKQMLLTPDPSLQPPTTFSWCWEWNGKFPHAGQVFYHWTTSSTSIIYMLWSIIYLNYNYIFYHVLVIFLLLWENTRTKAIYSKRSFLGIMVPEGWEFIMTDRHGRKSRKLRDHTSATSMNQRVNWKAGRGIKLSKATSNDSLPSTRP